MLFDCVLVEKVNGVLREVRGSRMWVLGIMMMNNLRFDHYDGFMIKVAGATAATSDNTSDNAISGLMLC